MAPIFASPDIAALVAAFQPLTATRKAPSLVRSTSGNNLLDSRQVLKQFRTLLETSPSRIRLADLPSRLDVSGKINWLLASSDSPVYYGREGQTLVPQPEIDRIRNDVLNQSKNSVLDATTHSVSTNISTQTLRDMFASEQYSNIHWWQDPATLTKQYIYSDDFAEVVGAIIRAKTEWNEGIDLSQRFESAPAMLLLQLAKDVQSGAMPAGEWQVLNGRTVFVAQAYVADADAQKHEAQESKVKRCVDELGAQGWTKITTRRSSAAPEPVAEYDVSMLDQVKARYAEDGKDVAELVEVPLADKKRGSAIVLITQQPLECALDALRLIAPQETAKTWHAREGKESIAELRTLALQSLDEALIRELLKLLMQSSYFTEIESIINAKIEELQSQDQTRFQETLIEQLLSPLALYAAGMAIVQEPVLKEHLEEFLGEHFRRTVVPSLTTTFQSERLLLDRSRRKDYEKFQQASAEAKTLSEISSAATKLARKQKLPYPPNETMLQKTKSQTLHQTARSIRKLPRGSDVLQNLIWLLLGRQSDGLYMSAGRDTTRMLKQLDAGGENAMKSKLEGWRDRLKAGTEDKGMLEDMRKLAEDSMRQWDDRESPRT
ncbi:hypothetical protein LTR56_014301 [Elasticomyces elasticus]|nr:hypothetical protein LTR22_023548 [Elasticomyces elasticus]KAK3636345.1 hypothetical protein LTR56_014301 [Elasticomyces elasticus]KAK4930493.1 hypothetical protein LTR49_002905 [Elasticomyces elasticus]KAK5750470.1 hypothetical protein LTS12_019500 [Elasticomyces elasticus]